MVGYNKGEFINTSQIMVKADSIAANRGYGAFDFFGVINGKPFYLDRHLERFYNTMHSMRLKLEKSPNQLSHIVFELIERNKISDFYIKLFAYPIEGFLEEKIDCDLFIVPVVISPDASYDYKDGVKLIAKEYQRFLSEAKSTNYLPLVYWQKEILSSNAIDVLYYSEGFVRETSRGNVFIVKEGKVFTPKEKMLKGISRSVVIDILRQEQISISEEAITLEDVFSADEVFLSSTTKKILPVVQIGDRIIGDGKPGAIVKFTMNAFDKIQKEWH